MRHLIVSTAVAMVLATPVGWAAGANNSVPATSGSQAASVQQQQPTTISVVAASRIVGRMLKDSQGADAGQIDSLVIDSRNGVVDYVMVSSAGSFNTNGSLIAVPWAALQTPSGGGGAITLAVTVDKLLKAPRINPGLVNQLNQPEMRGRIYGYYGYRYPPYYAYGYGYGRGLGGWGYDRGYGRDYRNGYGMGPMVGYRGRMGGMPNGQDRQAQQGQGQQSEGQGQQSEGQGQQSAAQQSQGQQAGDNAISVGQDGVVSTLEARKTTSTAALQSATVYTPNGDDIGGIDQVMIDVDRGEVAYILVARGGFLGIAQTWLALPIEALTPEQYQNGYELNTNERVLRQQPALPIDRQDLPVRVSAAQLAALYQQFGIAPYWEQGRQQVSAASGTGGNQAQSSTQSGNSQ